MADVKLFLSCVSDEFRAYREALRHALTHKKVEIKVQEDFKLPGGDTLAMLEDYIESCDVVVHFIADMVGSTPKPTSVDDLLQRRPELVRRLADKGMTREDLGRLTYTQWEAWLEVGFNRDGAKRNLVIVAPTATVERDPKFDPTEASRTSQVEHLRRLKAINIYPGAPFTNADNLAVQVLTSAVLDAVLNDAGLAAKTTASGGAFLAKPRNLPFASLAACSPVATRTLLSCTRRCWTPRAPRSRLPVSGESARRGLRSNMRGLARPSIRRFCSSARATAPRSTRV
jgi:Domain of unknown function (DUF4062)